jgi:hypothetical protein
MGNSRKLRKDLTAQKRKAGLDSSIENFIEVRDKTTRGVSGAVDNMDEAIKAEINIKDLLYQASLSVTPVPEGLQPISNMMLLSAKRNQVINSSGIILPSSIKKFDEETDMDVVYCEEQVVLAIGPNVFQANVGMDVKIDFSNFKYRLNDGMKSRVNKDFGIKLPVVEINNVEYLKVTERDLDYILNTNGIEPPNKIEKKCQK